jgi:hypothetical protein
MAGICDGPEAGLASKAALWQERQVSWNGVVSRTWVLMAAGVLLASCQTDRPQVEPVSRYPKVTRTQIMELAEAYRTHPWLAAGANVRHGLDRRGVRVDTPDVGYRKPGAVPGWWVPGQWNRGVPYQWGGFSTLAEFDAGVARGLAAGDVYTLEKRALLDDAVSTEAVGIDCSGFVSRCWRLPRSYSTRELASVSVPLASYDDLLPGDILNTYNAHCLIFAGWVDASRARMVAYETGIPPHWKVIAHRPYTDSLMTKGFKPFRYRNVVNE